MRHNIITFLIFIFSCQLITAQDFYKIHNLKIDNLSDGISVFSTEGDWAGVIVQCKKQYDLKFSSNVDNKIIDMSDRQKIDSKVYKKETAILIKKYEDNNNRYYHFMFRTDKKFEERYITIGSIGFHPCLLNLFFLSPKSLHRYRIYDENDIYDNTKFQEHKLKGQRYYTDCNYLAAKQEFTLAKYCVEATEEDKESVQANINKCDSMMYWIKEGNKLAEEGLYNQASHFFHKASINNNLDRYTYNRFYELSKKQSNLCSIYYAEAEKNFRDKAYETARDLYQIVVDRGCEQQAMAEKSIAECNTLIRKRINTERYIGLDFGLGESSTVGFTSSSYKKNIGSYISLRTNNALFELIRNNYKLNELAIVDATIIGMTIPIIKSKDDNIFQGIWINAGLGCSIMNKYKVKDKDMFLEESGMGNNEEITQEDIDKYVNANGGKSSDWLSLNVGFAASPEIGIFVKVWRLGLRLNYQKRFIISKSFKDNKQVKEECILFGLGYCF